MGLDGGTKITRSDVLRGQSWRLATQDQSRSTRGGSVSTQSLLAEKKLEKDATRRIKWSTCALTEQPLESPVVADFLGNLYNKSAVLTFLLNRRGVFENEAAEHFYRNLLQSHGPQFRHLQKRRDVFELKTLEGEFQRRPIDCPVSGLDCLSTPFSAFASCGHVFSDRAIEEMKDGHCMECSQSFTERDVVHLNCGKEEQRVQMRARLKSRNRGKDQKRPSGIKRKDDHPGSPSRKQTRLEAPGPERL